MCPNKKMKRHPEGRIKGYLRWQFPELHTQFLASATAQRPERGLPTRFSSWRRQFGAHAQQASTGRPCPPHMASKSSTPTRPPADSPSTRPPLPPPSPSPCRQIRGLQSNSVQMLVMVRARPGSGHELPAMVRSALLAKVWPWRERGGENPTLWLWAGGAGPSMSAIGRLPCAARVDKWERWRSGDALAVIGVGSGYRGSWCMCLLCCCVFVPPLSWAAACVLLHSWFPCGTLTGSDHCFVSLGALPFWMFWPLHGLHRFWKWCVRWFASFVVGHCALRLIFEVWVLWC